MSPVHGGRLALTLLLRGPGGGWRLAFPPDNFQTFCFLLLEIEDNRAVGMCCSHLGRGERTDSRMPGIKRPEQAGYRPIFTISAAASRLPIYVTVLLDPDIALAFYCLPCKHHKESPQLFLIPSESVRCLRAPLRQDTRAMQRS